ncbi:hypothetical protein EIN_253280 [Entamoeba invadens IP1]|uniref:Uncharacterized protein n=1 Tax=Entamoeba invadens IP1 TaxID=370355 RepID=A0A0A1UGQ9_ENTIV|nr:hypothetical protein EIN_253280 [Entamoeba invadens IP1]ELP95064.1 hypothetical protein EIN_253280 [Entamoeba invadens IP1]|eukprot:XP_004261835.1 hypothetical protein EIN_253280 [Entamoeba invadens IP1]
MKTLLERVYMMNVVLYIETMSTLKKLIQINKKCYLTCQDMYSSPFKLDYTSEDLITLFSLFPKLHTLYCDASVFPTTTSNINKEGMFSVKESDYITRKLGDMDLCVTAKAKNDANSLAFIYCYADNIKTLSYRKSIGLYEYYPPLDLSLMTSLKRFECSDEFLLTTLPPKKINQKLEEIVIFLDTFMESYQNTLVTSYANVHFRVILYLQELTFDQFQLWDYLTKKFNVTTQFVIFCNNNNLPCNIIKKHVYLHAKGNALVLDPNTMNSEINEIIQWYGPFSVAVNGNVDMVYKENESHNVFSFEGLDGVFVLSIRNMKHRNGVDYILPHTVHTLSIYQCKSVVHLLNLNTLNITSIDLFSLGRIESIHLPKSVKQVRIDQLYSLSSIVGIKECKLDSFACFTCPQLTELDLVNVERVMIYNCRELAKINTSGNITMTYLSLNKCPNLKGMYFPKSLKEMHTQWDLKLSGLL